jgi:hypothetical protein
MKSIKPLYLLIAGIILLVSPAFLFRMRMSGNILGDYLTLAWLILFVAFLAVCIAKTVALIKRVQLKPEN